MGFLSTLYQFIIRKDLEKATQTVKEEKQKK